MRRVLVVVVVALVLGFVVVPVTAVVMTLHAARTHAQPGAGVPVEKPPRTAESTYHIDCRSRTDGDGSLAHPWNSTQRVAEHGRFGPGDEILLARGSICTGTVAPLGNGSETAPIVLGAYGDGAAPVVQGGGTPDQTGAVQLTDVRHWTVQDLVVTNRPAIPDGAYRSGVLVLNTAGGRLEGIRLQRLEVRDVMSDPGWRDGRDPHEFGGISLLTHTSDPSAGFDDVRIVGNEVEGVGRVGIVTWNGSYPTTFDHDLQITDNTVTRAQGDSVLMYGADGGIIARNTSAFGGALQACGVCSSDRGNTASAGIWPTRSKHVLVDGNEVYGEHAAGGDGQGLDVDIEVEDVVVQRNYVHDNEGGGALVCGAAATTFRANVFRDNAIAAFVFNCDHPTSAISIVNNDISTRSNIRADVVRTVTGRGATSIVFANNVVSSGQRARWDWPGPVTAADNTIHVSRDASAPAGSTFVVAPSPLATLPTGAAIQILQRLVREAGPPVGPSSPLGAAATDFFGTPFDPAAPGRGAVAATPAG